MNPSSNPACKTSPTWMRYRPSQAALVSMAVGATLFALFVANWAAYRSQPQRVAWSDYMQWPQIIALSILWLAICAMTYWLVQLWHEELPSDDASIESAWRAGMAVLRARGQTLDQLPLFVVLGNADRTHQQQLLEQGGLHLSHELVPVQTAAPLHWAFTDQGIWLFVQGAGTYTAVSKRLALRSVDTLTHELAAQEFAAINAISRLSTSSEFEVANAAERLDSAEFLQEHEGTIAAHAQTATKVVRVSSTSKEQCKQNDVATQQYSRSQAVSPATTSAAEVTLGSLEELLRDASQAESASEDSNTGLNPQFSAPGASAELAFRAAAQPALLSSTEITQHQHALREICRRLRSERRGTAPANGVVAIVPTQQLMAGVVAASELGLALRTDLQVVQDEWQLQTPTTVVVDGFERLPGARELVRRGGPELAKTECLGAAFPLRYQPEKHLLAHVCALAVGQVETRIYRHLQPSDGMMKVGNHSLFELLIACRSRLLPALQTFAGEALGLAYQGDHTREPALFAGVAVIASGQKVIEQAWARGALGQVMQSQNLLRWTHSRMRSEQRLNFVISCLKVAAFLLVVTAIWAACRP